MSQLEEKAQEGKAKGAGDFSNIGMAEMRQPQPPGWFVYKTSHELCTVKGILTIQ